MSFCHPDLLVYLTSLQECRMQVAIVPSSSVASFEFS